MNLKLRDRHKLAHDWVPDCCNAILDIGCAEGGGTATLADKAREVHGCDPNRDLVNRARTQYPSISFAVCPAEQLRYRDDSFDAVTMTDVFEHVENEKATLDEVFRVLKPGGELVITTPHRGLFSFMDTENYFWLLRTKLPWLHRWLFWLKHGVEPQTKPGYTGPHRHYSVENYRRLLDGSRFRARYSIEKMFRGGLVAYPIASNLFEALSVIIGVKHAQRVMRPLWVLCDLDYFIPYGPLAYNIALRVKKL